MSEYDLPQADREKLRWLCEQATPGPWEAGMVEHADKSQYAAVLGFQVNHEGVQEEIVICEATEDDGNTLRDDINMDWVAAACNALPRVLDALQRCERLVAWLRLDKAFGCEHPDWQIVAEYLLGDTSGRDVFAVIDEMSREIDAVMARVVERARQVQP